MKLTGVSDDDVIKSVVGHGLQVSTRNSDRARAFSLLAPILGIYSLDEVVGLEIGAHREDKENQTYVCPPHDPDIVGWSVCACSFQSMLARIRDFESRDEAKEFVMWLRNTIGEPLISVRSLDASLEKRSGAP